MSVEQLLKQMKSWARPGKRNFYSIYVDNVSDADSGLQSEEPKKTTQDLREALEYAERVSVPGKYVEIWGEDILAVAEDNEVRLADQMAYQFD